MLFRSMFLVLNFTLKLIEVDYRICWRNRLIDLTLNFISFPVEFGVHLDLVEIVIDKDLFFTIKAVFHDKDLFFFFTIKAFFSFDRYGIVIPLQYSCLSLIIAYFVFWEYLGLRLASMTQQFRILEHNLFPIFFYDYNFEDSTNVCLSCLET